MGGVSQNPAYGSRNRTQEANLNNAVDHDQEVIQVDEDTKYEYTRAEKKAGKRGAKNKKPSEKFTKDK